LSWYTLDDPNDPKLDELATQLQLHPLHVEDCRSHTERVKAERGPNYLFLILRSVDVKTPDELQFSAISIFMGHDFCITVGGNHCPSMREAIERARKAPEGEQPAKIVYHIFDGIVDSYFAALDTFDDRIDELEDRVLDFPTPEVLQKILDHKRGLIDLRRVLVNTRDASLLCQHDAGNLIEQELWPFFRDIYDHVARNLDLVETLRDLLSNSLDVYLSSIANRTNEVMKVLTVMSTIVLPSLVISSIYGMNIKGIPFMDSPHGTEIVGILMVASTVLLLYLLRKFRWV
jgi:magnesium transporter